MERITLIAVLSIVFALGMGIAYSESYIIITQDAGQTTNPFCIQDSAGTNLICLDTSGNLDLNTNSLKGSMSCSDNEILDYNSATDTWDCTTNSAGETNTASNIGAGTGLFSIKSGVDLQFDSLIGGTGIDISDTTDDLTLAIDATVLTTSSNLENLGNVTSTGCASDEILKVSGSSWVCATDGGGTSDIGAKLSLTSSQNITSGVNTIINFTSELWDTDGIHSNTTNNDRATINTSGKYLVVLEANFQALTSTSRVIYTITDANGVSGWQFDRQAQSESDTTHTRIIDLNAGEFIRALAYHTEGIAKTFNGRLALQCLTC